MRKLIESLLLDALTGRLGNLNALDSIKILMFEKEFALIAVRLNKCKLLPAAGFVRMHSSLNLIIDLHICTPLYTGVHRS